MARSDRLKALRIALDFLPAELASFTHEKLPAACVASGLPKPSLGADHRKYDRAVASFNAVADELLPQVAQTVLALGIVDAARRNQVQDALWAINDHPQIPARTRREIAGAIDTVDVFRDSRRLIMLLERLWVLDDDPFADFVAVPRSLRSRVQQHLVRNDDWDCAELFAQLGAIEASDRRFALFLEGLASADNVPDEAVQRAFVAAVQPHLERIGLELRETGESGGYPVFTVVPNRVTRGQPKNLLFASLRKPDVRLIDAIDNDLEIVGDTDAVLAYGRAVGADGLRWRDLQLWWQESRRIEDDAEAKRSLFWRLRESFPKDSPDFTGMHPQRLLYELYHMIFKANIPELPALLPEVWLHYDPKSVRMRRDNALFRFRMDFLMLLPNGVRVVIEVDGRHHYAKDGRPDPDLYAKNMRADRDLKLNGYEVYRFGASELQDEDEARASVEHFFTELFRRFRVSAS